MADQLTWKDNGVPVSTVFDDVYFGAEDGIGETTHIFLGGNNLPARGLEGSEPFHVYELGFGTGLNFLVLWQAWEKSGCTRPLRFTSVEKYPISHADMMKAHSHWPSLATYSKHLLDAYKSVEGKGMHVLRLGGVELCLAVGDVRKMLFEQDEAVDAFFMDGFSPAKNPDMWQPDIYAEMARLSRKGTTLATFTAAGHVRRGLQEVGFDISKAAGYGRKRETITGVFK